MTNCKLRTVLLYSLEPDFICLNNNHLSSDSLELDGFTWLGHNRTAHRRVVKASDGVGIFLKTTVFDQYSVNIVDKVYDEILCLHFEHCDSQYGFPQKLH